MTGDYKLDNFLALLLGIVFLPLVLGLARRLGLYAIVAEREAQVFTLFGKVLGTLDEPGIRFPIGHFGLKALLVPFFGELHRVDTRLRQNYLRDQMVNSGEGTPMGVGIWYEMQVNDTVAYLFANANPEGSLEANVSSAAISTLSNLEMDKMLEDRHQLSQQVRHTVSPLSEKWGYRLGSVYIRKVAFTDRQMVDNITDKVVKRLVQVTSAMKQDGENRVGLIKSQTAYKVSQKMAEASAARPAVVGDALNAIAKQDPEVLAAVLEVLETQKLIESGAPVDLVPTEARVLVSLGAAGSHQAED
ncbi:MAG TPA: SPFH domain-containing protein [Chromatiaceae bacterium]|nr:SPFH domain-containing protein [Chromatiaceae bacterium]